MKKIGTLDSNELFSHPDFFFARLFFEKNYANKTLLLDPAWINLDTPEKEGVYYLVPTYADSNMYLRHDNDKEMRVYVRGHEWCLITRTTWSDAYLLQCIKITVL